MEDELTRRVQMAIEDLEIIKSGYIRDKNFFEVGRINGKIEGVKLVLDYYVKLKELENI